MTEFPPPPGVPGFDEPRPTGPQGLEKPGSEEFLKGYFEKAGGYPIPAPDLIEDLQLAEIGEDGDVFELEKVIRTYLAYKEGLVMGPSGEAYQIDLDPKKISTDIATKQKLAYLETLFTTVESATNRPHSEYAETALKNALDGKIRRAQAFREDQEAFRRKLERKQKRDNRARIANGMVPLSGEQQKTIVEEETARLAREYAAIPRLLELENHVHARAIFDGAFNHRMRTCEDPGLAAKLGSSEMPTYTPDGGHWLSIWRGENGGEYGRSLNAVFDEMVKFALPDAVVMRLKLAPIPAEVRAQVPEHVYAEGFENATEFAYWLNHNLKIANGRMDIVWNAWKMMLTWEVADNLGEAVKVEIDDKTGQVKSRKWVLAAPPIGNTLHTYTAHLDTKRQIEFGLEAPQNRRWGELSTQRGQVERYISHSGLPMSLGKISNTCENYFKESELEFDKSYLGKPDELDKQWMRKAIANLIDYLPKQGNPDYDRADLRRKKYFDGLRKDLPEWSDPRKANINRGKKVKITLWDLHLYGRLDFSDENFPWIATDQQSSESAPGELGGGSVGMWYLTRSRCWGKEGGVVNDIRSRPSLRDLGDPDFFASKLRNWAKVLGTVKEDVPSEENHRAWWVLGILRYHVGGTGELKGGWDYRATQHTEALAFKPEGTEAKSPIDNDIYRNATNCGFLRPKDVAWIKERLQA